MNTLREQQIAFARAVFDDLDQGIGIKLRTHGFSDAQRLQIYRNNIHISLREALSAVYPVLEKLVGTEFFRHLASHYIVAHPSDSGNIHTFGGELPAFVKDFPGLEGLPYLSDVAHMEWLYHEVFHAPPGQSSDLNALLEVTEDQLQKLRFDISPACRWLHSGYPVLNIWQANQDDSESDEIINLDQGETWLLVLRNSSHIEFHTISRGIYALVNSLHLNNTFTEACAHLMNIDPECDISAAVQYMISKKIISGFSME